jgi:hypothetical protein
MLEDRYLEVFVQDKSGTLTEENVLRSMAEFAIMQENCE